MQQEEHFFEEQMYDSLHKTLTAGYRRHWRPILKERGLPMGQKLNKEVRKHAQQSADSHLQALKKKLDFVVYGE